MMTRSARLNAALAGLAVLAAPFAAALAQAPAAEMAIEVVLDRAKLVKLPAGADMIVVGNPSIADVAVQKNGVMVITGKATGRTNLIALDSAGSIISESLVAVTTQTAGRVIVQHGLEKASYDCVPQCSPTLNLGDEEKYFARIADQVTRREGIANGASGGSARKPVQ
ncbi:MAG: pilus assembly protein N-terminal domain-containing protein [Proteobacteria bacterium]|nr:pilus assembly protein N-terminal domain-containing protein [Pseudomonadota bacterium]